MRIFYIIMFLVSIAFTDVISRAAADVDHEVSLIDNTSESENETELEVESKEESKVRYNFASLFQSEELSKVNGSYNFLDRPIINPYREIHSPPPDQ